MNGTEREKEKEREEGGRDTVRDRSPWRIDEWDRERERERGGREGGIQ